MDATGQVVVLFWVTVVAVGAGAFASGLLVYHSCLGWFISRASKQHLENAVEDAERHMVRRARRRHEGERRRRVLRQARVRPAGRHLAP
jgi:hypothetical protein